MSGSTNTMLKKEKVASPGEAGTKLLNTTVLSAPKYSMIVLGARLPGRYPAGQSLKKPHQSPSPLLGKAQRLTPGSPV